MKYSAVVALFIGAAAARRPAERNLLGMREDPAWHVRGEKFTQDFSQGLVDYEDKQADTANTRLPYASTLVQMNEEDDSDDDDDELMQDKGAPEKVEASMIPSNFQLVQQDDNPSNIETMADEGTIPLNMRLLHVETEEGELMMLERM